MSTVYFLAKSLACCPVFSFNVLLDRCFATSSAYNVSNRQQHDFFIGYGSTHTHEAEVISTSALKKV